MSYGAEYQARRAEQILRANQEILRQNVETVRKQLAVLAEADCAAFIREEIAALEQQINRAAAKTNNPLSGIADLRNFSTAATLQKGKERKQQHDQLMQERAELQQRCNALCQEIADTASSLQVFKPHAYTQLQEQARALITQYQDRPTAAYSEVEAVRGKLFTLNATHQTILNHGAQVRKTLAQLQEDGADVEDLKVHLNELEQVLSTAGELSTKQAHLTQLQTQAFTQVRHQLVGKQLALQAQQESERLQLQEQAKLEQLTQQLRQREAVRARWQQAISNWDDAELEARCRVQLQALMEASVEQHTQFSVALMQEQIAQVRQSVAQQREQELAVLRAEEQRVAAAAAREAELQELRRLERANAQAASAQAETADLETLRKLRLQAQQEYELLHERERLEQQRRQTVIALKESLEEAGFDVGDPGITPGGNQVIMRARRSQGEQAQVMVYLDGKLALKFDSYGDDHVEKCATDIAELTQRLQEVYGIETQQTGCFFEDPRRIRQEAKSLPPDTQYRQRQQQQRRSGAK